MSSGTPDKESFGKYCLWSYSRIRSSLWLALKQTKMKQKPFWCWLYDEGTNKDSRARGLERWLGGKDACCQAGRPWLNRERHDERWEPGLASCPLTLTCATLNICPALHIRICKFNHCFNYRIDSFQGKKQRLCARHTVRGFAVMILFHPYKSIQLSLIFLICTRKSRVLR